MNYLSELAEELKRCADQAGLEYEFIMNEEIFTMCRPDTKPGALWWEVIIKGDKFAEKVLIHKSDYCDRLAEVAKELYKSVPYKAFKPIIEDFEDVESDEELARLLIVRLVEFSRIKEVCDGNKKPIEKIVNRFVEKMKALEAAVDSLHNL